MLLGNVERQKHQAKKNTKLFELKVRGYSRHIYTFDAGRSEGLYAVEH